MQSDHASFNPATAIKEIMAMPEFVLRERLLGFQNSIYIFDGNFHELRAVIVALISDPGDLQTAQFNHERLTLTRMEIARRLHNYVAAAVSLIDHTRRLYRKLYTTATNFPEYNERVQATFVNDPLSEFIKGLRQYCQHYSSVPVGVMQSFGFEEPGRAVYLSMRSLSEFGGWSAAAKVYIAEQGERGVDILVAVSEYRDKVTRFYEWFQSRQRDIHKEELGRLSEKEVRLGLFELEGDLNICLNSKDVPYRARDIFSSFLTADELQFLASLSNNPEQCASRTIALLEQEFSISQQIKDKIRRVYLETTFLSYAFAA